MIKIIKKDNNILTSNPGRLFNYSFFSLDHYLFYWNSIYWDVCPSITNDTYLITEFYKLDLGRILNKDKNLGTIWDRVEDPEWLKDALNERNHGFICVKLKKQKEST